MYKEAKRRAWCVGVAWAVRSRWQPAQALEGKLRGLASFLASGYRRGGQPRLRKAQQAALSGAAAHAAPYAAAGGPDGELPPAKRQRQEAVLRQEEQQCALPGV